MKKRRVTKKPARKKRSTPFSKRRFFIMSAFSLLVLMTFSGLAYGFYILNLFDSFTPLPTLPTPSVTSNGDPLTSVEYQQVRAELYVLVDEQNPKIALKKLELLGNENPSVLRSCHAFVHDIGHRAFNKYGDVGKAFAYQDDICGSGYLHGIIESYFKYTPNVLTGMKTLCAQYGFNTVAQRCYHGVGHGLMFYSENDLPLSVEQCNIFTGKARVRCLEGVYMEHFNTDQKLHPSSYLRPEDPFYPCAQQPAHNQAVCYFYAPAYYLSLHQDNYAAAMSWCAHAPGTFVNACTNGLATRIMKQRIANPQFVERICESGTSLQVAPCIDGMVSYYVVHFDSWQKAQEMCATLKPQHKKICQTSVAKRRVLFE